ncbi:MAG: TIR domain-containing protein, partial [Rhodothermales bacterium]
MADIFISYKREDREWAEALSQALETQGWTTWWDTRLAAGESFDRVIEQHLDAAKCVIVLWSKLSVESRWVIAEAGEGLERDIIVPVFIENARPPLVFRRIHTARLTGWGKSADEAVFKSLVGDISRILGPSPLGIEQLEIQNREKEKAAKALEGKQKKQDEKEGRQLIPKRRSKPVADTSSLQPDFVQNSAGPPLTRSKEITHQGIGFVLIPEGSFQMGSNDGHSDEQPIHQ